MSPTLESIARDLLQLDETVLLHILDQRLRRLPARKPLLPLARDEDPADIFIDSFEWLAQKKNKPLTQLLVACETLAERWVSESVEEIRLRPEPLGELLYLCARIGVQKAVTAIARVIERKELEGLTLPGGEDLQLRALRSLCGLLMHTDTEERKAFRQLLEKALDNPRHLPMALTALVAFWPEEKEKYLLRVESATVNDPKRWKAQLERNVRLMQAG